MTIMDQLAILLSKEQKEAAYKAYDNEEKKGIIWWKIGEGKTRIALYWSFLVSFGKPNRPLIICSPGAVRQWQDEIRLLAIRKFIKPSFLSYGSLSSKYSVPTIAFSKHSCIIVDELWLYKNPKSQRSELMRQITKRAPAIGLSGSMMTAGNIEDLYGQSMAMTLAKKVAPNMTNFRSSYMIEEKSWAGFPQRYPRKGAAEAILTSLAKNVSVYFPKEVKEIRDIEVNVEPTPQQEDLRKQLTSKYYYATKANDFELEIKSASTLLVKLQQVSDGFLRNKEGNILPIKSSKSARLIELCQELLDSGERVLIWVGFRKTAELLSYQMPAKTTILSGDGKFDVYGWRDGKVRITIATVGSGSSLNDFADIRYSIFYSTTFSNLSMQQARGRTNRKSSLHSCCYYYFLQTRRFPDKDVYQMIEANASREETITKASTKVLDRWKKEQESFIDV